jgi:hypothetical protein
VLGHLSKHDSRDHMITGSTGPAQGANRWRHAWQCTNAWTKATGSQSAYPSTSITFSTCIAMYKKQGAPNRCTSLHLLLLACTSLRTKTNRLLIDVPLCFYYVQHVLHRRGSQSMYLSTSTTFTTCIAAYKKQEARNRHTSLLLLLSAHASPRTKSKKLTIDVPLCFYI